MMEPETIAYAVVGALLVIKIIVYIVYKKVIQKAEQDELAHKK